MWRFAPATILLFSGLLGGAEGLRFVEGWNDAALSAAVTPLQAKVEGPELDAKALRRAERALYEAVRSQWPLALEPAAMEALASEGCDTPGCWLRAARRSGVQRLVLPEVRGSGKELRLVVRVHGAEDGSLMAVLVAPCPGCDGVELARQTESRVSSWVVGRHAPSKTTRAVYEPAEVVGGTHSEEVLAQTWSGTVTVSGIEVGARIEVGERLGCVWPGQEVPLTVVTEVRNRSGHVASTKGILSVRATRAHDGVEVLDLVREIDRTLGADAQEGGLLGASAEIVTEASIEVDAGSPLNIQVRFEGERIAEALTRPAATTARLLELGVEQGGRAPNRLRLDDEVKVRARILNGGFLGSEEGLPVVLRIQRRGANILDRDAVELRAVLGPRQIGPVVLEHAFLPEEDARGEVSDYEVEFWIGGCRAYAGDVGQ
jgi:hypothetical protein